MSYINLKKAIGWAIHPLNKLSDYSPIFGKDPYSYNVLYKDGAYQCSIYSTCKLIFYANQISEKSKKEEQRFVNYVLFQIVGAGIVKIKECAETSDKIISENRKRKSEFISENLSKIKL